MRGGAGEQGGGQRRCVTVDVVRVAAAAAAAVVWKGGDSVQCSVHLPRRDEDVHLPRSGHGLGRRESSLRESHGCFREIEGGLEKQENKRGVVGRLGSNAEGKVCKE